MRSDTPPRDPPPWKVALMAPGVLALMAAQAGRDAARWWLKVTEDSRKTAPVKLIHASELQQWRTFPRYQDANCITYGEYRMHGWRILLLRLTVSHLIAARKRLREIDSDDLSIYKTEYVKVPGSLIRRSVRIPLTLKCFPETRFNVERGQIIDGHLHAVTRLLSYKSRVEFLAPSRVVNAEEIEKLSAKFADMTSEQRIALHTLDTSIYAHPVLFISHQWESENHPDPSGEQLRRLQELRDCFIIYDYTSFPQIPRSRHDERVFQDILSKMNRLIRNVIILESQDYLTRGWCVYEYLVASMTRSFACDEVQDPRFVALRDWLGSRPYPLPVPTDGYQSQMINDINEAVLDAVNKLLPVYRAAQFRFEHDHGKVTGLLRELLREQLPARREYMPYVGEHKTVRWTDSDLELAFEGQLLAAKAGRYPFNTRVPRNIEDAVREGFEIRRAGYI